MEIQLNWCLRQETLVPQDINEAFERFVVKGQWSRNNKQVFGESNGGGTVTSRTNYAKIEGQFQ